MRQSSVKKNDKSRKNVRSLHQHEDTDRYEMWKKREKRYRMSFQSDAAVPQGQLPSANERRPQSTQVLAKCISSPAYLYLLQDMQSPNTSCTLQILLRWPTPFWACNCPNLLAPPNSLSRLHFPSLGVHFVTLTHRWLSALRITWQAKLDFLQISARISATNVCSIFHTCRFDVS